MGSGQSSGAQPASQNWGPIELKLSSTELEKQGLTQDEYKDLKKMLKYFHVDYRAHKREFKQRIRCRIRGPCKCNHALDISMDKLKVAHEWIREHLENAHPRYEEIEDDKLRRFEASEPSAEDLILSGVARNGQCLEYTPKLYTLIERIESRPVHQIASEVHNARFAEIKKRFKSSKAKRVQRSKTPLNHMENIVRAMSQAERKQLREAVEELNLAEQDVIDAFVLRKCGTGTENIKTMSSMTTKKTALKDWKQSLRARDDCADRMYEKSLSFGDALNKKYPDIPLTIENDEEVDDAKVEDGLEDESLDKKIKIDDDDDIVTADNLESLSSLLNKDI